MECTYELPPRNKVVKYDAPELRNEEWTVRHLFAKLDFIHGVIKRSRFVNFNQALRITCEKYHEDPVLMRHYVEALVTYTWSCLGKVVVHHKRGRGMAWMSHECKISIVMEDGRMICVDDLEFLNEWRVIDDG